MRRHRHRLPLLVAGIGILLAACGAEPDPRAEVRPLEPARESGTAASFALERVAQGLSRPTFVGTAPGDEATLWVLEQSGRVVRVVDGSPVTALDLTSQVRTGAEQGLLGLAFHPRFATDPRLYLHWSDRSGDTRVAEFRARPDGTIEPEPIRELIHVEQPEENHNGGQLAFGPDGRLHLGLGDGGGAFDPDENAQRVDSPLGKVLALDVDAPARSAEPRWDVVLYGLRNPWRFSFDMALGEIWVADVGQDDTEEVNRVLLEPNEPPKNLGWSAFEGTEALTRKRQLDGNGDLVWPVAAYSHDDGCSITGGMVYRGTRVRALQGRYVYGDFCSGALWSLAGTPAGRAEDVRRERASVPQLTHIGADAGGELLFASAAGAIYQAVPAVSRRRPRAR